MREVTSMREARFQIRVNGGMSGTGTSVDILFLKA